jgi:hypothetical protein
MQNISACSLCYNTESKTDGRTDGRTDGLHVSSQSDTQWMQRHTGHVSGRRQGWRILNMQMAACLCFAPIYSSPRDELATVAVHSTCTSPNLTPQVRGSNKVTCLPATRHAGTAVRRLSLGARCGWGGQRHTPAALPAGRSPRTPPG